MSALLTIHGLRVHYGVIEAIKGINLELSRGGITALVGANGAGKSTTLLALSGLLRPTEGSIIFDGVQLTRVPPHKIVGQGLIQVPEGREILTTLSVRENLLLGAYRRRAERIENDLENVINLFPRLRNRLGVAAGNLSGGEQQMLAIARALMARPRLLLLDEPSMGLAPLLIREIFKAFASLREQGLTILLVEQNVRLALQVANYAYVMENGLITLQGTSRDLQGHPMIVQAYLGR